VAGGEQYGGGAGKRVWSDPDGFHGMKNREQYWYQ
jgi:hypothetical protein